MKKSIILLLIITISSCKTAQVTKGEQSIIEKIIQHASSYKGTKYKYGGTTKKGMDCSGLIYVSFKKENITLPRVSRDMATRGKTIAINKIQKGDLLFFATGKKNSINHVGLVATVKNETVFFIHASSSKGVITSSLQEKYYKKRFVKAKRIID